MHPMKTRKDQENLDALVDGEADGVQPEPTKTTAFHKTWSFLTDVEVEREFDRLLSSTMPATASSVMLGAQQETLIGDRSDQVHNEIVPEMPGVPSAGRIVNVPEAPSADSLQPATGDKADSHLIPSRRGQPEELEPHLAEMEPRGDAVITGRTTPIMVRVPEIPVVPRRADDPDAIIQVHTPLPAVPRREDSLDAIITFEEFQETMRKEAAADRTREERIAQPTYTRPLVPYRPPVFGEEEASDDEPQIGVVVQAEVHGIPFSRTLTGSAGAPLQDVEPISIVTSAPVASVTDRGRELVETTPSTPSQTSVCPPPPTVVPGIVITEMDAAPDQPQDLGVHEIGSAPTDLRVQAVDIAPGLADLGEREVGIPVRLQQDHGALDIVMPGQADLRERDVAIPAIRESVPLDAEERDRPAVRRSRDEESDLSESPPSKKRKWDPKYRFRFRMKTLKKRYNRTRPFQSHILPLDELAVHDVPRSLFDLHNIMPTFNNYEVDLEDILEFKDDEEEIYADEPTPPEPTAPVWIREAVLDAEDDVVEPCDEEEILDLLRDVHLMAGPEVEIWKIVKEDLLKSGEGRESFTLRGRKSSIMGVMAHNIREDLRIPKRTLLPELSVPDVPITRVSDTQLPEQRADLTEEVVRSARRLSTRELLVTADVPPVEQPVPEAVALVAPAVVEPPKESDDVVADRRRLLGREAPASGEQIQAPETAAPPDERGGIREQTEAPVTAETAVAPQVEATVSARTRETLADAAALPTTEPVTVPLVDEVLPTGELVLAPPVESAVPTAREDVVVAQAAEIPPVSVAAPKKSSKDEVPISEIISKELRAGGVFIAKGDPSLFIQCGLPVELENLVDWDAPVRQVRPLEEEEEGEEEEDDEEPARPPRPRISRMDVVQNLRQLLQDGDVVPLRFSKLCPVRSTTKYISARTLDHLLYMHNDEMVKLETDSTRTFADAILIFD